MRPTTGQIYEAVGCTWNRAAQWADPIREACSVYSIDSPKRIAAFLAQVGHETLSLSALVESLNYSPDRLREVCMRARKGSRWHSLLPRVAELARNPQGLAEAAYGGRMGNGPEGSGDGWKFRGRSPIHITGLVNYEAITEALLQRFPAVPDLVRNPEQLELPEWGALSAGAFWDENELNAIADTGDIDKVSRRVNGGKAGLSDRRDRYRRAMRVLMH